MTTAAEWRAQALARAAQGDDAGAAQMFARAVAAFPRDAALANSAGNFHAGAGRPDVALALFERALAVMPQFGEAAINRAVVLTRLGRGGEAAAALRRGEAALAALPRYWTTRAAAEVADDDLAAAAASYDRALAREPGNARALHGRARTALDRGEGDAVARYERALAAHPGDPQLLLGLAQAIDAAGDPAGAMRISGALAAQLPGWVEGLELHARLRWAAGDRDGFCDHYRAGQDDAAPWQSQAAMLAGVDRHTAAAEVLARARRAVGDTPGLALAEAVYRGEAGDVAGAAAIFDRAIPATPEWLLSEGRHRLRTGDPASAERLLADAIAAAPGDIAAWSLRDLCWRLLGDPRHAWLHGQPGLIREIELDLSPHELAAAQALLDTLHDRAAMPVGQSVKDGSQTRGALFQRPEPAIATIAASLRRAVERYRDGLPAADAGHPLLRTREAAWRISGSWSIRLSGVGHHAAHIHPLGIVSSAAYFRVPAAVEDGERSGWLELGRPPATLGVGLPPLAMVKPRVGWCALFPSTLYHGTRPIASGRRMTVAVDVTVARDRTA